MANGERRASKSTRENQRARKRNSGHGRTNKNINRQSGGYGILKKWSEFEKEIENTNLFYQRKGRGAVAKIPNGMQTVKQNKKTRNFRVKTPCDFIGQIDGIPVAFDVKTTSNKTSFPIFTRGKNNSQEYSLKKHQANFLTHFDNGGKAFVLIHSTSILKTWLVPIEKYLMLSASMQKEGKKSINFNFLKDFEVYRNGLFWDYAIKIGG